MIVVGVDGSPASEPALHWAADEAARRGTPLHIVHAEFARPEFLSLYRGLQESEDALLAGAIRRARALQPGIEVTGTMAAPPAASALVQASGGAEMLVVGSRGLGQVNSFAVGSVALECAHLASCPVVIVRPSRISSWEKGAAARAAASG